ncbi:hypothetical protein EBZ35_07920, partial [bacterium]|nr:hypothetical protein [bacterium]
MWGPDRVFRYTVSNDTARWQAAGQYLTGKTPHATAIAALVRAKGIHIVHVHNFFPQLGVEFFAAVHAAGARVFHTLHNYRWWCPAGTFYRNGQPCVACRDRAIAWPAIRYRCANSFAQSALTAGAFAGYRRLQPFQAIDGFFYLSQTQYAQLQQTDLPLDRCYYKPNGVDIPVTV